MLWSIINKQKSMTRRVIGKRDYLGWASTSCERDDDGWPMGTDEYGDWHRLQCPYGTPGDRLWVKHGFWRHAPPSANPANEIAWDEVTKCSRWPTGQSVRDSKPELGPRWSRKPSIFMPRWASIVLLQVTAVRLERLQAITDKDVVAEGVRNGRMQAFKHLWNTINQKRGYGWSVNPYVWAVSFKVLKK